MQLIDLIVDLFAGFYPLIENVNGTIGQRSFPGSDHCGMDTKALGQLGGGVLVSQSGQCHFSFKPSSIIASDCAFGNPIYMVFAFPTAVV